MRKFIPYMMVFFALMNVNANEVNVDQKLIALEKNVVKVVDQVKGSVVALKSDQGASGSGVIVNEDGLIFTAAHVVEGSEEMTAVFEDGSEHRVKILGMNRFKDAALAQLVEQKRWQYAPVGDSDSLDVTDWVIALGHGRGFDPTRPAPVRFGRVRAHNPGRFITTDCTLIGGDSGGPLYNLKGEVVAIHSSINGLARFNVHAGVSGFKDDLDRMLKGERWGYLMPNVLYNAETPILGVDWNRKAGGDPRIDRPYIGEIVENGPADRAKLRFGDLIRKVSDEDVQTQFDVAVALGRQKVGNTVSVIIERQGEIVETKVTLEARGQIIKDDRVLNIARLTDRDDSPYVKTSDKPRLKEQAATLYWMADDVQEKRDDTYVGLYLTENLSSPVINGTVIAHERVLAPLSAVRSISDDLVAWRPGIAGLPVKLLGGYEEHDLALLKVPGLSSSTSLLDTKKNVKLGEFIYALALYENSDKSNRKTGLLSKGVVSVLARELPAFFGVGAARVNEDDGAMIGTVVPQTAAEELGLQRGDIIKQFNGQEIQDFKQLSEEIVKLTVGSRVNVTFLRENQEIAAEITLKNGKGNSSGRIGAMDQMGRNSLSRNRSDFQTVLQSDMIIEPEQCGAPVFGLSGNFVGIAISDAGRNKSYIIPANVIGDALKDAPRPVSTAEPVVMGAMDQRNLRAPQNQMRRSMSPSEEMEEMQRMMRERMKMFEQSDGVGQLMDEMFKNFFGK